MGRLRGNEYFRFYQAEFARVMTNVLVTGSSGFIGKGLCASLNLAGYGVVMAVRQLRDMEAPRGGGKCVAVGNIGQDTDWRQALAGVDTVVHLAARVHVMKELASDPLAVFRAVNVAGTENLARSAAKYGVKRLVYLSSIKVNGESTPRDAFTENDAPHPQDAYAISKWEAEQWLHEIAAETGLEIVIIRPPLVYGPGVGGNFIRLLDGIDRRIPLPFASVRNRRSLVFLGNLIDALVSCVSHPAAAGKTYLISDGEDVSTPELIERVAVALGRPARLFPVHVGLMRLAGAVFGKSAAVERLLSSLTVDNAAIRRELGWVPPYSMAQGLTETANWYKARQ